MELLAGMTDQLQQQAFGSTGPMDGEDALYCQRAGAAVTEQDYVTAVKQYAHAIRSLRHKLHGPSDSRLGDVSAE